jgi:hypothetical protein
MYESHHHYYQHYPQSNEHDENELVNEIIPEDEISHTNSRTKIHWNSDREGDMNMKQQINTNTEYFDALFARSKASPPTSPHPRCYSSCSPSTVPFQIFTDTPAHNYAKSQPHLISSSPPHHSVQKYDDRRRSTVSSSTKSQHSTPTLSPNSAKIKRKKFSVTHAAQVFLQSANSQCEQLEPLARSCSYKRPQSIKKYRQQKNGKEKEKEQKEYSSSRKYSTYNNNILHTVAFDSARKSVSGVTSRISATDLMATDDPHEQWSIPKTQRTGRVGKRKISNFLFFSSPSLMTPTISYKRKLKKHQLFHNSESY